MAAAAAVSGAKRSLRTELKQRLRAISAEERLRQSRLLTQKVRDRRDGHREGPVGRARGRAVRACGSAQAQASGARSAPVRAHIGFARSHPSRARPSPPPTLNVPRPQRTFVSHPRRAHVPSGTRTSFRACLDALRREARWRVPAGDGRGA